MNDCITLYIPQFFLKGLIVFYFTNSCSIILILILLIICSYIIKIIN